MIIDTKDIIPEKSLPRFNSQRRIWLNPAEFNIDADSEFCVVSFLSTRGKGRRRFSRYFTSKIGDK